MEGTFTTGTTTSRTEGPIARAIEEQTSKLPSDTFLWAAAGSIVASAVLRAFGKGEAAVFVGQWAPTLLILGLYNKIVKVQGHDRFS
ncbi:MAG: hypothetical protein EHM61_12205 [Acidobacteria bacterium]|nr:MAG: hypothetical protein EHM61_12205 [Acidobacteriota bacterium]